MSHPSVEKDLCLKIEVREQTIWQKYSKVIANFLYSNEIHIHWEFFSKILQMALAMV